MAQGRILVIAGSDSSGGAGLEADQKVIAAHGCYAMTATAALTAQNTTGVFGIQATPSDFVRKQIDACLDDIPVDVVKIGMLASAETVLVVADALRRHKVKKTVIDPLLPLATILTPNVPEAMLLLSDAGIHAEAPTSVDDLVNIAKTVQSLGPEFVLLKGGHLPLQSNGVMASIESEKEMVVDVLYGAGAFIRIDSVYQESKNTHGTGCSLASAIASNIANGFDINRAVKAACRYVEAGIRTARDIGAGNGPINHFHSVYALPFAPGRFIEYLLDRPDVKVAWQKHTEHRFLERLADGTLPVELFKNYLIQDYLYLVQYARATALAGYKAKTLDEIAASATVVTHIIHEMNLHVEYCEAFGVSKEQILATEEDEACTAYTRYVLDVGHSEDWFALQIAMAPCLIGYGVIARRLYDDPLTKREGNIYWKWIENYVADDFAEAVKVGSDTIEKHALLLSPSRLEELVKIFIHATNMETGFWNMGEGQK
ncbi:hypothetical protein V501_07181 [Pseudogymnoascus sp. VKM F-4519 (FW-2642)]|nr:hypothetical protein V499_07062 [Pseudogymnoascus sp. VKM F-103]KFZ06676.1 hypothetical protein V501_07181 [Pseudogymnoascus sp. VKM F-4519 (FW-2642)]